ncbi:MAG: aminotransferase class V-fold PLP-dependent enzyme [Candidatus Fermentibacter sp.]|nr:aminotransferase class V-fold PLP-dependent enzyme [Candidatus Fermentibacter sp.]
MNVYLDNNATTPLDPLVLARMLPFLGERFGNPSSFHSFGSSLMEAIEESRGRVASLIGAPRSAAGRPAVVFTSGGTESDNWALRGSLAATGRRTIVTTPVEHPAVLETARQLEREGFELRVARVTCDGVLDMDSIREAIDPTVAVLSVMAANNETGVLMPIRECAEMAHSVGALFHTDAVQAAGKIPLDAEGDGIDLLSLSAHKIHGPKGVGALYVRPGLDLPAFVHGGHHESGLRAGTYNVPGIAGLGEAARLALEEIGPGTSAILALRDRLENGMKATCPGVSIAGALAPRLPNTTTALFSGVESEAILTLLDMRGISVSSGSACSTGSKDPSHVLRAMNVDRNLANSAVRFSLSRFNTAHEIDYTLEVLADVIDRLRRISPYV